MTPDRSSAGRARRIYHRLLGLAPRRLRARHGDEMAALFLESWRESPGRAWFYAVADLLWARARDIVRRRPSRPLPQDERSSLMLGTDLTYTVRWLSRQKLSTSLVVGMLTVGMAANIVVFSLVNGLFLRPFPFPDPDRLVDINETAPRWNLEVVGINYPDFHQWQRAAKLFEGLALYDTNSFNLSDERGAERITGANVTAGFAAVLGIRPLAGRMFTEEEDRPKGPPVVVIGEGLWRERFGASPDAVGRTLKLNGVVHTIVGVMPRSAEFPGDIRLWAPLAGDPNQTWQGYGFSAIGRLKPGVTAKDAEADLVRAQQPIWDARDKDHIVSPYARPLHEQFVRDYRTTASTLLTAVALLLVVACANVASVMLARALARRREMGIRLAVGASRVRLARQLFLENLALSLVGGLLGLALGRWALRVLLASAGDQVPQWANFGLDARVVGFSVALSGVTAMLFGWAPALHATRGNLRGAITETAVATTAGTRGRRTLSLLVAAEFALAAILLVCGGLLLRAYERVRSIDPGFRPDHVLTFSVSLPEATYPDDVKRLAFWNRLNDRLAVMPGVVSAGIVSCPPLSCHWGTFYDIEGRAPSAPGQPNPVTLSRPANPSYFRTMGIRLKTGRFFEAADGTNGRRGIIVNETFVKTFWPGVTDPVGRRIRGNSRDAPWMTVVGFVEDVRHYGLERPMRPGVYVPLPQSPAQTLTVVVRTSGDPGAFAPTAHAAVREIDPDLAVFRVRTMDEWLRRSMAERSLYSWLLGIFAGMALVLALGGTYGVTSYLVSQRARELGIRVALGARRGDIARAVLRGSLAIVGAGVVVGTAASIAAARLLADRLFGVPPHDVRVLTAAIAVLVVTAAISNWLPARRAAAIDPMRSLRAE